MDTVIEKLFARERRIWLIRVEGETLSLTSASPSEDRREQVESLLDSLLEPRQLYLFRHRRRREDRV